MHFPTTNWERISAAAAGSHEAFRALAQEYERPLLAYFAHTTLREYSEDLLQETYLALHQNVLARADPEHGRFRTLLLTVARNTAVSELRKRNALTRGGGVSWSKLEDVLHTLSHVQAEEAFNAAWVTKLVETPLTQLETTHPHYEQAIRLTVIREMSYTEAAEKTGATPNQIRNWVHRGKRKVQAILREAVAVCSLNPEDFEREINWIEARLA